MRHATPDWSQKDIPYDIVPGPGLIAKGEAEARVLGIFLKREGLRKLYYSPFARAAQTAKIIAAVNEAPCIEENGLSEWRGAAEHEAQVRMRMSSIFELAARESKELGPVGLVSHGGPIAVLLLELGFPQHELAPYQSTFDTTNPLPPAGAWKIEKVDGEDDWKFELVFIPKVD